MTPPYVRFLPYTRYFSRLSTASYPLLRSTLESWGASRRPHRGPVPLPFPYGHSLSNRKRLSFYSPRLPTIGRLPFPQLIENDLFFKRSSVVRTLVPGSFSPRGVSHRPCSFGLNFVPPFFFVPSCCLFQAKVCLTSTFPLEWLFWSEFCPSCRLLTPNATVQGTVCLTSIFLLEWLF
ncbi:hypothetical protein TNCT_183221, partial [Trichonephila clavata]